jgi:hypothetical protein
MFQPTCKKFRYKNLKIHDFKKKRKTESADHPHIKKYKLL